MSRSAIDSTKLPATATTQRNVEAKFRLTDSAAAHALALRAGFQLHSVCEQCDTYFAVANSKLKLREEAAGARLIQYRGAKKGDYIIVAVAEPAAMRDMLTSAVGVLAQIKKRRTLLVRDNIRVHFDEVEGLGEFGEIEIIVTKEAEERAAHPAMVDLLATLGVTSEKLVAQSYLELVISARPRP